MADSKPPPKYVDQQINKIPGGSTVNDLKHQYLDPFNIVGDPGDVMNLGGSGYDAAIQGAKDAQAQANALSSLQWQRQMTGLNGALGYVDQMQALYNSLYGPGGGKFAPGGVPQAKPNPMSLSAPMPQPTASTGKPGVDYMPRAK